MANPNDEPLRARGRPATPETALRATLAQATLALLLDGGYAAATVDAVAKRAGWLKTLYRFAANRDELVAQVVSGWTEAFQPAFAQDAGQRAAVAPLLEKGCRPSRSRC